MAPAKGAMAVGLLVTASTAYADPVTVAPLVDVRTRYETVRQDGFPADAQSVTTRIRAGVQASDGPFSLIVEGEGLLAIVNDYSSGTNGRTRFPGVADPQNVELNRLQIQYRPVAGTSLTVGRQIIALDDERFVGPASWRQNQQTFDAARLQTQLFKGLKVDVTYMWSDRTIYGIDGTGLRPQAVSGDNVFVNVSHAMSIGTLTGFAYLIDQDQTLLRTKSSQSYGARFAGTHHFVHGPTLGYAVAYARQSDWNRNPNSYVARYYLADLSLDLGGPTAGAGYEVLGADDGVALTSFQTPLASLNRYQGWADLFLTTPPDGVRDAYGSIGYKLRTVGPLSAVATQVVYHRFDSDRLGLHYGDEIDAQVSANLGRYNVLARLASFHADELPSDVRKVIVQLSWTFGR